jgi:tagatose 1,6-diphosphate aldolase
MGKLTIGKLRGLQQLATDAGIFNICALDHRGSLKTMLEKCWGNAVSSEDITEFKLELCETLAPHMSSILLDPIYGAAQSIGSGRLPGRMGLLVSVEATGYENTENGRLTTLLDGWGVEKIKKMGASAVKILIYYRPDLTDIASLQLATVRKVAEDCIKFDIPFLVEPVSYPIDAKAKENFAAKKPEIVVETARQVTELPIEVLKAEFPADMKFITDENKLLEYCYKLNRASKTPWVLLSAGVTFDMFKKQVEIACKAGASGFVGGRAIWQESAEIQDKKRRMEFMRTTVAARFNQLVEITTKYAAPWYRKASLDLHNLAPVNEGWYGEY